MKTKKILAMLLSLSMMATTVATMSVSANEDLANIAGTATMSTNGNDGFWPIANANDGNSENTAGAYGATEDTYIQADFGNAQLIKEIVVENANDHGWKGTGKARVIRLSNDANFTTYEEMVCYERVNDPVKNERLEYVDYMSKWSYEGNVPYRYARVYAQPAMAGYTNWGGDATPSFAIKELYVYAEEMPSLTNVAGKAVMSTNGNDGFWSIGQANDGNSGTTAGIYGASEDSYIQADLGFAQDIKEVVVENANQYGNEGTGKARVIQLSNDPNFAKYEEMVCYNRINDGHTKTDVDYISKWWYGGDSPYRYVRVYATPGAAGNTNYGTDSTPSFAIKELNLYATEKTAGLTNVLAGNVPTLTSGGAWAFGTVAESLTDGNKDSVAYSANSLAIFELDHAMDIEQVEIDLRADGEPDDPNRHYEVYLSNTANVDGAVKLLGVEANHESIAYNTIVLPVDSDAGYKYVLVGSTGNFWGLTEVRAMSTGEYVKPDMPEGTKDLQVVSVGKPVYSQFWNGYNFNILALNDGDENTAHAIHVDGGVTTNAAYGFNSDGTMIEGFFDHIIDLEAKYPIEKVTVTKPGNAEYIGVSVSNDPNANNLDWLPLVYDEDADIYYIDEYDAEDFGTDYQFVKIELTPGVWAETQYYLYDLKEVSVYSTSEAAADATIIEDRVNIAAGKKVTSNNQEGAFGFVTTNVNDGDMTSYWFTYAGGPTVTFDLGGVYPIENVRTYKIDNTPGDTNSKKGYGITKVELSNEPNFGAGAVTLVGSPYRKNNTSDEDSYYTSYSQNVLPSELGKYRYVRVTGDANSMEAFKLNEVEIYTNSEAATLKNVLSGKVATLTSGGAWAFDTVAENLTDGDNNTVAYSATSLAVFELDHAMDIEQVEIDLRADGESDDPNRHYEVYLSNTGTMYGALKVLDLETSHDKIPYNTIVLPVDSDAGYKYVLVGSTENFWGLTEVRALSTGEYVEPDMPETKIINELTGAKEKGSVLTLSTSYVGTEIDKTLNLYIARYDNGRLTDVVKSGDLAFVGAECLGTLEYTITEEVTAQTEFRGYAFDKSTMEPFASAAGFEPYAEFWVDPSASENGDGSESAPFNSIRNARDSIRSVIPGMEGDIVVNLKGGKYYVDDQNYIYFDKQDGGANGYNVIWKNAPGETPVVSAGKPITDFIEGEDGIWYADASEFDSIYELTVNGEAARIAGTEEPIKATKLYGGNAITGEYTDGIGFAKSDLPQISNASDAYVHVASSWVDVMYTVDSVSVDGDNYKYVVDSNRLKSSTKKEAFRANNTSIDADDNFYVENALELLDNPGEFYFDKGEGTLYYMPRSGEDMETAVVEGTITDSLMNISGERNDHIKNLVISGIRFENASYALAYETGFTTGQAQVMNFDMDRFVEGSIWVNYADNIEISDCEFTGITKPAVSFVEGVLDSKITRNKFYNIGSSAVVVGTNQHHELEYAGEERCERNIISDNVVENPAMKFRGSPAIACYYVVDTDIVHNKIVDCNYSAISLGWGWNENPDLTVCANNTVAENYIENVNLIAADGGAVYTLGRLPNAIVEGNYYVQTKMPQQTSGTIGIYFDEGTQDVTARNNVIDMKGIEAYSGNKYAISAWTNTIKNVVATSNYATLTAVENSGTNCTIDTPTAYTAGQEPAAVQNIIAASAVNLK